MSEPKAAESEATPPPRERAEWPHPHPIPRTVEAIFAAQRIAFGPVVFQCARVLLETGALAEIERAGRDGIRLGEVAERAGLSTFAATVLLDAAAAADLVRLARGRYTLSKVGYFLLHDKMTRINFDFVAHVCYRPFSRIDEALKQGKPAGLADLWDGARGETAPEATTIYEVLGQLPEPAKGSWFRFDHHYSDGAFEAALETVLRGGPARLLDVGGNTGRFARTCVAADPKLRVTIADLPGQLAMAETSLAPEELDRVERFAIDVNDREAKLPSGFDVVWMSQFLVCFDLGLIVSILRRAREALAPGGRVLVLDTFWDRADTAIGAYCIALTSPYFGVVANGTSRMLRFDELCALAREAGLEVESVRDQLGVGHTLVEFTPSSK